MPSDSGRKRKGGLLGSLGRGVASILGSLMHKDEPVSAISESAVAQKKGASSNKEDADRAIAQTRQQEVAHEDDSLADVVEQPVETNETELGAEETETDYATEVVGTTTSGETVVEAVEASYSDEPDHVVDSPATETDQLDGTEVADDDTAVQFDPNGLSVKDLELLPVVKDTLEWFGIFTVAELLLYRREELVELRGISFRTLNTIEVKVSSLTREPFRLPGVRSNVMMSRQLARHEMARLNVSVSNLQVDHLVRSQLRKSSLQTCLQVAITSRDEFLDCPGIDLETTYVLEEALGALLGVRLILGCRRGEPPTVAEGEEPYNWRLNGEAVDGTPKLETLEPEKQAAEQEQGGATEKQTVIQRGRDVEQDQSNGKSAVDSVEPDLSSDSPAVAVVAEPEASEPMLQVEVQVTEHSSTYDRNEVLVEEGIEPEILNEDAGFILDDQDQTAANGYGDQRTDYFERAGESEVNVGSEFGSDTYAVEDAGETEPFASAVDNAPKDKTAPIVTDDDEWWGSVFGWDEDEEESEWDDPSKWDTNESVPESESRPDADDASPESIQEKSHVTIAEWAQSQTDISGKVIFCLVDGMSREQTAKECNLPLSSVDFLLMYGISHKPEVFEDQYAYAFETYGISLAEFIDIFGQPARTYRYLQLAHKPGSIELAKMLEDQRIPETVKRNLEHRMARESSSPKRKEAKKSSPRSSDNNNASTDQQMALPVIDESYSSQVVATTDVSRLNTSGLATKESSIEEQELEQLVAAVLSVAKMHTEYSSAYFYKRFPEISQRLKANTLGQFHRLLRKAFRDYEDVTFPTGHIVCFDKCDRGKQLFNLMCEMSPVKSEELVAEYENRYGIGKDVLAEWLNCISRYYREGTYSIEFAPKPAVEEARAVVQPLIDEESTQVSHSESKEELLAKLRVAIDAVAKKDTEYSTDFFFLVLPELAAKLGASSRMDFYFLVEEAYKDSDYVTFPMGHVMCYGNPSREKQMLDLMKELSPVSDIDLAAAYEDRYGFNRHLVKRWYWKYSEYESNGIYFYKPHADDVLPTAVKTHDDSSLPSAHLKAQSSPEAPNAGDTTSKADGAGRPKTATEWALGLEGRERQVVQQTLFGNPLSTVAANASMTLQETSELIISTVRDCPTVREDSFRMHYWLNGDKRSFCRSTGEPESTWVFLSWRFRALGLESAMSATQDKPDEGTVQQPASDQSRPIASSGVIRRVQANAQHRIVAEVDKLAKLNKEYAAAFFFNELAELMDANGIKSADELFELLRHAYRHDPDVDCSEHGIIRFGICNREAQMRDIVRSHGIISRNFFTQIYRVRYGFTDEQIGKWIDEYDILNAAGDKGAGGKSRQCSSTATRSSKSVQTVSRRPVNTSQPKQSLRKQQPAPKRLDERSIEYEQFLRKALDSDCCDRRLVTERFRAQFPNGPKDPFSAARLYKLGYTAKGKKLLFKRGVDYSAYFGRLIDTHTLFSRGDPGFEDAVFNDPQFRQLLRRRMRSFAIVEYEKDAFIKTSHLCEQMGVGLEDIRNYSQDVVRKLRAITGTPVPFTIWSLRNMYHVTHPLDVLTDEGGMSDYLFETLFDIDPYVQCCTISQKRGFLETRGAFNTGNFIECLVELNGYMEMDELIDLLRDGYGIDYPEASLRRVIKGSSLYYDDLTDSVYNSRREWEEMVNRELA